MPGPWITTEVLSQALADMLKKSVEDLADYYTRIVPAANQAAADDITYRLMARGYSLAQIDQWDQRVTFNTDLGLFWALTKAGGLGDYSDQWVNKLDRRKELDTIALFVGGSVVLPGEDADGSGFAVGGGRLSEDGYRFNFDTDY